MGIYNSRISVQPDTTEQLIMLREQSRLGVVHEAQLLQLKYWPRILFPHSVTAQIAVDPEKFTVDISVNTKGSAPAGQEQRTQELGRMVQWLLGSNWEVQIHEANQRLLFLKRNSDTLVSRQADPEPKYAGTDFEAGKYVPEVPWSPKRPKPSSKPRG